MNTYPENGTPQEKALFLRGLTEAMDPATASAPPTPADAGAAAAERDDRYRAEFNKLHAKYGGGALRGAHHELVLESIENQGHQGMRDALADML